MKRNEMNRLLLAFAFLLAAASAGAQGDVEYRMEIGGGVGLVAYEGDFNGNPLKDLQPMGSLVVRRLFNPYMGLRLTASYGKLKGSSKDVETYYPDLQLQPYEFDRSLGDVSLVFECNLWPYGTGQEYRGAQRLTPYLFAGLGGTYAGGGDSKDVFTANVPLGLGVKYKIGDRMNLGVEWAVHFSLSDELDGVKDPYHVKSTGAFKNTDCYSALQLTLTYSFMAKCRTCHNADE